MRCLPPAMRICETPPIRLRSSWGMERRCFGRAAGGNAAAGRESRGRTSSRLAPAGGPERLRSVPPGRPTEHGPGSRSQHATRISRPAHRRRRIADDPRRPAARSRAPRGDSRRSSRPHVRFARPAERRALACPQLRSARRPHVDSGWAATFDFLAKHVSRSAAVDAARRLRMGVSPASGAAPAGATLHEQRPVSCRHAGVRHPPARDMFGGLFLADSAG